MMMTSDDRRASVLWVAVAGLLTWAAPAGAQTAKLDKQAAAKGRTTFVRYCVACHGMSVKGDGPLAKDLRVPVPDLTTLAEGGPYPFERVVEAIAKGSTVRGHGTDDMPAWGDAFTRSEGTGAATPEQAIRNVAHYIWSVQRPAK
jgi:mono/diheme cytochrome c family protein